MNFMIEPVAELPALLAGRKAALGLVDRLAKALDAETAHQVSSDILDLGGITRIVVTHTLEEALLRRYDGILVLKTAKLPNSGALMHCWRRRAISTRCLR